MPYYEYVYIVDNLIDILKEKQKSEEESQVEAEGKYSQYKNPNAAMRNTQAKVPKIQGANASNVKFPAMPSMPNIKI